LRTVDFLEDAIEIHGGDDFECQHARQAAKLALKLFDKMQPLHKMGNTERIWLRIASLLHDIGKSANSEFHHKASQDIIIRHAALPFRKRIRKIIGLIARYHKGATPKDTHKYYRRLNEEDKRCVMILAGMLRMADGLDAGHKGLVTDLACQARGRKLIVYLVGKEGIDVDKAVRKADLLGQAFDCEVEVRTVAKVIGKNLDFSRLCVYTQAA